MRVLFLGDSNFNAGTDNGSHIGKLTSDMRGGFPFVNSGVPGRTVGGGTAGIDAEIDSANMSGQLTHVVVMLGTNDYAWLAQGQTVQVVAGHIQTIATKIANKGLLPLIVLPPPNSVQAWRDYEAALGFEIAWRNTTGAYRIVNPWEGMTSPQWAAWNTDGTHLTVAGRQVVATAIAEALAAGSR